MVKIQHKYLSKKRNKDFIAVNRAYRVLR